MVYDVGRPSISRARIFVSYHHNGDQAYYDAFSKVFCDSYDLAYDNSLERMPIPIAPPHLCAM